MYQRAVKIARVLEESENETRALNLGKRKMGSQQGGFGSRFQGGSYRPYRPNYPQDKGKQPMGKQGRPLCGKCKRHHFRPCNLDNIQCFGCWEVGHKMGECPKAAWNQPRTGSALNQQRPHILHLKANHLHPIRVNNQGTLRNGKSEGESIVWRQRRKNVMTLIR